jgi:drug/metabolite transporter (DMT)-like permease
MPNAKDAALSSSLPMPGGSFAASASPVHGIHAEILALAMFATMDALVKGLDARYPALQVALCRNLFGVLPLLWMVRAAGGWRMLATRQPLLQLVRIIAALTSLFGFFYLFPLMPLAELYAVSFAAPLFMTALGVPLLGERVGRQRWSAVVVGFIGVLIIVQPGSAAFHPLALGVVGATFCSALSLVCVRRLSRTDRDQTSLMFYSVGSTALTGAVIVANAVAGEPLGVLWIWPAPFDWLWLVAIGLVGGVAQIWMTRAFRLAPAAVLAPFEYAAIVFALAYGWLFWREVPSLAFWLGLPLVIGSGLYTLHRERARAGLAGRVAPKR